MNTEILASQVKNIAGFTLDYSLATEYSGDFFGTKWSRADYPAPDTITFEGEDWRCEYFTVGKDCTYQQALKEFKRDIEAFDVVLQVQVRKCGITLLSEIELGDDYSYDDGPSDDFLSCLLADYADDAAYIESAKNKLMELIA